MSELEIVKQVSGRVFEIFPKPIHQEHLDPLLHALLEGRLVKIDKTNTSRVEVEIAPTGVAYTFPTLDMDDFV